jgi:NAD(P) transhydrogenase subunit alpha
VSTITEIAILVLAAFVGFEVIAIHGIVLLGGLLLMAESSGVLEKVLLVIAVMFGTINIIGGFFVTDRMLEMFKRKPEPAAEQEDGPEATDS